MKNVFFAIVAVFVFSSSSVFAGEGGGFQPASPAVLLVRGRTALYLEDLSSSEQFCTVELRTELHDTGRTFNGGAISVMEVVYPGVQAGGENACKYGAFVRLTKASKRVLTRSIAP